jgi:hypothetical protein
MLFEFQYDFDTESLSNELLSHRDEFESYQDDRLNDSLNNWLILRENQNLPVLREECERFCWDFGLFKNQVKPRYYVLERDTILPKHIDHNTRCSINHILSDNPSQVTFDNGSYSYQTAVLDTSKLHGVDNTGCDDRLLFKLSFFDISFERLVECLKSYSNT